MGLIPFLSPFRLSNRLFVRTLTRNGPQQHRQWRCQVLSIEDVFSTSPAQARQASDQGRGQEGCFCHDQEGRRREERRRAKGRCPTTAKVLPNTFPPKEACRTRTEDLLRSQAHPSILYRPRISPHPPHRCRPRQASCLLEAARVWTSPRHGATSAVVDISKVAVPEHINDAYFKRTKAAKKTEEGIFEKTREKYTASEQRKTDQKAIDAALLAPIAATPYMKGYLQAQFGLSRGQYPHNIKF